MTILLAIFFGAAVFGSVLAAVTLYTHKTNIAMEPPKSAESTEWVPGGEPSKSPATVAEDAAVPDDKIGFAPREIHLPGLPELCTHRPFGSAVTNSHPLPEPVAACQLGSFAA